MNIVRMGLLRLFALMVVAASLQAAQPPNAHDGQHTASNSEQAPVRVAVTQFPSAIDKGCNEGQDERQSELCANWKSADANRDAAKYALIAILLSGVGTGLLYFTFREQRRTSRAELRAYVNMEAGEISDGTHYPDRSLPLGTIGGAWIIKNTGQTPAYDVCHWGEIALCDIGNEETLVPPRPLKKIHTTTLPKDGTMTKLRHIDAIPTDAEIEQIRAGRRAVFVYGRIEYADVFGKNHFTEYRVHYAGTWPPPKGNVLNFSERGNKSN